MVSHLSNKWNNGVALLLMRYGDADLSSGSAFFWQKEHRTYLVTNWHNLAGRNPITGELLSPTGAIPDHVVFGVFKQGPAVPDALDMYEMNYTLIKAQICEPDHSNPIWFEHPTHGRNVDIAAFDVTDQIAGTAAIGANTLESDAVFEHADASQDVFVVGFPFGILANAPVPIWKRGSIALEPTFDPDGLPKLFIDTATRAGMSGSVVVARHTVVGKAYRKKDRSMAPPILFGTFDVVIGVYSGRLYPDLEKAQLGIAWKRHTIDDTVTAKKVTTYTGA